MPHEVRAEHGRTPDAACSTPVQGIRVGDMVPRDDRQEAHCDPITQHVDHWPLAEGGRTGCGHDEAEGAPNADERTRPPAARCCPQHERLA